MFKYELDDAIDKVEVEIGANVKLSLALGPSEISEKPGSEQDKLVRARPVMAHVQVYEDSWQTLWALWANHTRSLFFDVAVFTMQFHRRPMKDRNKFLVFVRDGPSSKHFPMTSPKPDFIKSKRSVGDLIGT